MTCDGIACTPPDQYNLGFFSFDSSFGFGDVIPAPAASWPSPSDLPIQTGFFALVRAEVTLLSATLTSADGDSYATEINEGITGATANSSVPTLQPLGLGIFALAGVLLTARRRRLLAKPLR